MKAKIIFRSTLLLAFALLSFKNKNGINKCYISFTSASNLRAAAPDRLPESSEMNRTVKTENGEVKISRVNGYRVLYNNEKNAPFVNLKVELSANNSYETDQKRLIDNLRYLNTHSIGSETKELIELQFNNYKILGTSRGSIEAGSILGTFVMFPGNGVTVYFYFNNLKPNFRNFENVADYKKQRNKFLDEYTKHLKSCLIK